MNLAAKILWSRTRVWIPFLVGSLLLYGVLGQTGSVPSGDAPHILGISDRLAMLLSSGEIIDAFDYWTRLVTPHPPAGYLVPALLYLLGASVSVPVWTSLFGLALVWHGLVLLAHDSQYRRWGPWMAAMLLFSSAMSWAVVSQMAWDVLCAGCVAACVGHLHVSDGLRHKGHALAFGAFMGLGFMTKYTFPAFMLVPSIMAGFAVVRFRSYAGLFVALSGFVVIAGPWLFTHGASVLAYVASSTDPMRSISDSPASTWSARLSPENVLYYPTVLRDSLGWPGLLLCGLAMFASWMRPAGRWAIWSVVGGTFVLTFAGENQARYLFPALPMLAVLTDIGLRPGFRNQVARIAVVGGVCACIPALFGTWSTYTNNEPIPPVRDRSHPVESLASWGDWPWPMESFRPVENPVSEWGVNEAVAAVTAVTGPGKHQVGLLLPRDVRMPSAATYAWVAGRQGTMWDVATIVEDGPHGRPMVFVGPVGSGSGRQARRFKVAYAVYPKGASPELMNGIRGQAIWNKDLPHGFRGSVFRVPAEGWDTSMGQLLQKDPIDG
ncbi:MAG: ArnT family glycosyltransferase [Myxococcota bacterium]